MSREAFEKWWNDFTYDDKKMFPFVVMNRGYSEDPLRRLRGDYVEATTFMAEKSWQASRQQLINELRDSEDILIILQNLHISNYRDHDAAENRCKIYAGLIAEQLEKE